MSMKPTQTLAMLAIREELRDARKRQGLSLQDVANMVTGFTRRAYVANWESGQAVPSVLQLERWAHALGYELRVAGPGDPS
jgi:transcriptional regulator with XRE-family HTH domain